jgi:predicted nucleic acid-binding protein
MILYLDTSSLVKLYIEEIYSERVREWADDAEILATCRKPILRCFLH